MLAQLTYVYPSVAADSELNRHLVMALSGKWRIKEVKFAPDTAVAASDTNYVSVTISTNTLAAPTTWTAIGVITTQVTGGAAFVLGTTRSFTLSGAGLDIDEGCQIRVEKLDPGTGAALHGCFGFELEKIN
jgi:hypothetical protein